MIEGLTILNTTEVSLWWIFAITMLLAFLGGFFMYLDGEDFLFSTGLIAITVFIVWLVCSNGFSHMVYNEYEAIVSDEASLSDITEKYEIAGQEGSIYILKDKVESN